MIQVLSYLTVIAAALFLVIGAPARAAGSSDGISETAAPYDEAKALVEEGSFAAALPKLEGMVKADPRNADAWNLLGFAYRKLGHLDESDAAYLQVLAINPDHRGALEYQGELFITQGKLEAARGNLDRLRDLCGDCDEAEDLARALDQAA